MALLTDVVVQQLEVRRFDFPRAMCGTMQRRLYGRNCLRGLQRRQQALRFWRGRCLQKPPCGFSQARGFPRLQSTLPQCRQGETAGKPGRVQGYLNCSRSSFRFVPALCAFAPSLMHDLFQEVNRAIAEELAKN